MATDTKNEKTITLDKCKSLSFAFDLDHNGPSAKLADVSVCFHDFPFEGMRLVGFAVWTRREGSGRNVTFPARSYSVRGDKRSYALLRPVAGEPSDRTNSIRDVILEAYAEYEKGGR
jgi:hypothetical protein